MREGGVRGGRRVLLVVMAHLDGQNNSWIKILHTSLTTDQQAWSSLQETEIFASMTQTSQHR